MSAVIGNLPWKQAMFLTAMLGLALQAPGLAAIDEKSDKPEAQANEKTDKAESKPNEKSGKAEAKSNDKAEPFPVAAYADGDPVFVAEIDGVLFELQKSRQVNNQNAVQAKA